MSAGRLMIRTDGGPEMGIGHFMRCLALAQAWKDLGGSVEFAMSRSTPFIHEATRSEGFAIRQIRSNIGTKEDAEETAQAAHDISADWIVLDGYRFDDEYESVIRGQGFRLLSIDDYGHASHHEAHIVLNQNAGTTPDMYTPKDQRTTFLTGPRYALLRKEFMSFKEEKTIRPKATNVLVTLGGGCQKQLMQTILTALNSPSLRELSIVIAAGTDPTYRTELQRMKEWPEFARLSDTGETMTKLMNWADIAISAGGTTCWDLAFMGVPFIGLAVADNQKPVLERAEEEGIALYIGWHEDMSEETLIGAITRLCDEYDLRRSMSERGRLLVPGTGAEEVSKMMMGFASSED